MLLRYFYDQALAQASYMVGCVKTGEALIVDPSRNIQPYLEAAQKEGLRITHVTETHIHADFVSGSCELHAATGAPIYLSDMGDAGWKYDYRDSPKTVLVREGDFWMVGNIKVEVLHTPGHTPEHIAFMITDTAGADMPIGIFTGDFLFVGDVGRPDLLEEAAGQSGSAAPAAQQQFNTVQRFKTLPDYLQIWPGHGAGSACGKALGAIPSTTLGYEKRFNPAFQFEDQDDFVAWLLKDQPEAPTYFAQMKKVNKLGPALLRELSKPSQMNREQLNALLKSKEMVIDLRDSDAFAAGHVAGAVNVPAEQDSFTTYVGWYVDYAKPIYFIMPSLEAAPELLSALRAIGIDNVPSIFTPAVVEGDVEALPQISAAELATRLPQNGITVLDVRGATEFAEKHIVGARNIAVGKIPRFLDTLPKDQPIVTHCASGYRAQIAASLLRARGFENAMMMGDAKEVWEIALPTTSGHAPGHTSGQL